MHTVTEQKCPSCGAPLRFDPASGLLVCDYCGNKVAVSPEKEEPAAPAASEEQEQEQHQDILEGIDFQHLEEQVIHADAENLPVYNCVACGAEIIAPPEQAALTCPYCRNNIVLTNKISGKLRPDGLIPFRIESKDLPEAVRKYYKDKKLLPRGFFSNSAIGQVTGVYVPFWVFDGRVSGTINFNGTTSTSHRSGDYVVTNTNHYRLVREAALDFKELPVDAGSKIDDKLMDSLEPFRTSETKAFDMRYLAGFTADRFDQSKQDMASRAENRMKKSTVGLTTSRAGAGYSGVTPVSQHLKANLKARYLLFPVYLFDVEHAGKKYAFAVNGQTGKVVGNLPTDKTTSMLYFLRHAGIVSGALIAFSVARYMLGF